MLNSSIPIYLHLGTNLGNRRENLQKALQHLTAIGIQIVRVSALYETDAWGIEDQPDFINLAVEIRTDLRPEILLEKTQEIEQHMGRVRKRKWGERLIDIDLLYYGSEIIENPNLKVPHPGIPERNFVLIPMLEIASEWLDPHLQKTIEELYEQSRDAGEVRWLESAEELLNWQQ